MKLTQPFLFLLSFSLELSRAVKWDTGLNADIGGDVPAPTLEPFVSNNYPYYLRGSIPVHQGEGRSKGANRTYSGNGRLDYRQSSQCSDPTYILACPITENLPCCPPDYPVCCHDPSDKCCATGYFCVGTRTCCKTGTVACGEGCCAAGTTCCDTHCCDTALGYVCQSGTCVNPALSSQSVQSLQSVTSASIASVSSELAGQTRADGSDANTINTVAVLPSDPRIEYSPASDWVDVTSNSGVGSCNNGTKATQKSAKFTFTFSGTAIALNIIPSANGGPFSVQIDGEDPTMQTSKPAVGSSGSQCVSSTIFSRTNLDGKAHQITVQNGAGVGGSSGGTLEFNGIKYTGKGAFGTPVQATPSDNKANAAVIGGSVGGVLGAIVLVGGGILFFLYRRKKRNNANGAGAAGTAGSPPVTTPNQPMMYQHQPGPYSPPITQTPSSMQHPSSMYGGMVPVAPAGQQQYQQSQYTGASQPSSPGWSPQQQPYPLMPQQQQQPYPSGSPPQGWAPQQQQGGYNDYNRPGSGGSAGVAPLPMWVERASRAPADGMSMTTAEHAGPQGGAYPNQGYTH